LLGQLAGLARGLGISMAGAKDLVQQAEASETQKALGQRLKEAAKAVILLGNQATYSSDYTILKGLVHAIAQVVDAGVAIIPEAANSTGAHLAGALPHVLPGAKAADAAGENALELLSGPKQAYLISGFEPDRDTHNPLAAMASLEKADFVVALSAWRSPGLDAVADVLLPIGDFAETAGSYVNADGRWQDFQGAVAPPGNARPAWKVLRVLGNLLGLEGFDYLSARDVRDELIPVCGDVSPDNTPRSELIGELSEMRQGDIVRIADVPIYAVDPLVRRASSLQKTADALTIAAYLHPDEAQRLGVGDGDNVATGYNGERVELPVILDAQIPKGCVRIPGGVDGSERLGALSGPVILEKV